MLYGNYRFKCRFESEAHLPEYKGSTFRGVFGRALKDVVCALKRQECPGCQSLLDGMPTPGEKSPAWIRPCADAIGLILIKSFDSLPLSKHIKR